MYLIDTNVISEARKGHRANRGVRHFFSHAKQHREPVFLSVITIGELRRGVELIRRRGDTRQARHLETWLAVVLDTYSDNILEVDADVAQTWGVLRAPHHENALDKLIAATAMIHDLTVVTRNHRHFQLASVKVLNPFLP
jgi:predicted nucleic acid-binding protein